MGSAFPTLEASRDPDSDVGRRGLVGKRERIHAPRRLGMLLPACRCAVFLGSVFVRFFTSFLFFFFSGLDPSWLCVLGAAGIARDWVLQRKTQGPVAAPRKPFKYSFFFFFVLFLFGFEG